MMMIFYRGDVDDDQTPEDGENDNANGNDDDNEDDDDDDNDDNDDDDNDGFWCDCNAAGKLAPPGPSPPTSVT